MSLMSPFMDVNASWHASSVLPAQHDLVQYGTASLPSLGSSALVGQWSWANIAPDRRIRCKTGVVARRDHGASMRAAREAMRRAARETGQDIATLWLNAAVEWLERHTPEREPQPPAPAVALRSPRRTRSWQEVDAILSELRDGGTRTGQDAA